MTVGRVQLRLPAFSFNYTLAEPLSKAVSPSTNAQELEQEGFHPIAGFTILPFAV